MKAFIKSISESPQFAIEEEWSSLVDVNKVKKKSHKIKERKVARWSYKEGSKANANGKVVNAMFSGVDENHIKSITIYDLV